MSADPVTPDDITQILGEHAGFHGESFRQAGPHECAIVVADVGTCGCTRITVACDGEDCDWWAEADGTQGAAHRAHLAAVLHRRVAAAQSEARADELERLADSYDRCPDSLWSRSIIAGLARERAVTLRADRLSPGDEDGGGE